MSWKDVMTTTTGTEVTKAPGRVRRRRLLVIGVLLLLAVGAGGYWVLGRAPSEEPPPDLDAGAVVALDPISINLAEGRYLKLGLALQVEEGAEEEPEGSKAIDLAIQQYSGRPLAELADGATREASKQELLEKIRAAYHEEVVDIYLTEFVMQ